MPMRAASGRTALVVGAGIGGLAAALGLQRAGFAVEVLERDTALRCEGAGLSLWPNALAALDCLGIGTEVREAGHPQEAGAIRNARGKALSALDPRALTERFGEGVRMIERQALHDLLVEAVGESSIRLGAEAIDARVGSSPTVVHADASHGSADLVVGADGVGSTIRASLFDSRPPRPSGLIAWRGVVELDEQCDGRLIPGESWGRGALFGMTRLAGARAYWWTAERCAKPAAASPEAERAALLRRVAHWPDPAEALVLRTPPESILRTPLLKRRPLRCLTNDAVALLGDAAHPMLPHLGQGGCQALEDAAVLGLCFGGADESLRQGLSRYERARRIRSAAVVRRSARMSRIAHTRGPQAVARNLALRAMPEAFTLRQLDDIVGWRPEIPPGAPALAMEAG